MDWSGLDVWKENSRLVTPPNEDAGFQLTQSHAAPNLGAEDQSGQAGHLCVSVGRSYSQPPHHL